MQQCVGAEWDLFHRLDIAVRRALAVLAAAVELFDICKVMNALFGVGDGRAVLRATAALAGESSRRVADQGL